MRGHLALTLLILLTLVVIPTQGFSAGAAALQDVFILFYDWVADGVQKSAEYGWSVASAGDVNGDGYADVIIGAPKYTLSKEGAAFLFYGNPQGLEDLPSWSATGGVKGARFGHSVAGAGDLNCDGYDDVVIGAPSFNGDLSAEGAAFVFYGSSHGLSVTPDWTAQGDVKSAEYGISVAGAGDVDNDGCDDLLVGAHLYSNGQANEGAAFLYLGTPQGLSTAPWWLIEGDQPEALFGYSVSSAGDLNADGFADVLVGSPEYTAGEMGEGSVFVYHGSAAGLPSAPNRRLESNQQYSRFGASVAAAGDVNGDGFSDIAIGAPLYDSETGAPDEGAVFVYYGSASGLSPITSWKATSGQASSLFGVSVASAGDMDADGFADVLVGASRYSADQPLEGVAFIFRGSPTGMLAPHHWQMEGNKNDTDFGFSVSAAGDVNDDGFSDVIAGAPLYRLGEIITGRAFLYLGLEGEDLPPVYPLFLPLISATP